MANSWFNFKQFSVAQENAAFKVGTDSCLLASWIDLGQVYSILDVGTGSGVIALMLAQRSNAKIIGIDSDAQSSNQAQCNFERSPWSDRMHSIHQSLESFADSTTKVFDLIVSNPPYFVRSTKNYNHQVTNARHEGNLTLESLFQHSKKMLTKNGRLALVLPHDRYDDLLHAASENQFNLQKSLFIRPYAEKAFNRVIVTLSKSTTTTPTSTEMHLYQEINRYSSEAIQLLKPYYLYL